MITMRQFSPQEIIIRENEPGETAFVIENGKVEVFKEQAGRRVHIAFLEKGATFGEMSMVDDLPRSASVMAVEETLVREIHRDGLHSTMRDNPDTVIKLLKSIFERLRETNAQLARLSAQAGGVPAPAPAAPEPRDGKHSGSLFGPKPAQYFLEGLTPRATQVLSSNPFPIRVFPFKIGRKSHDPLVNNHLAIPDQDPLQISRHHVSIIKEGDRLGVTDRGSHLGASVDGIRIGGEHGPGPAFFKEGEGILVLGNESSPYQYRLKRAP